MSKKHPIASTVLKLVEAASERHLDDKALRVVSAELRSAIIEGTGVDATMELIALSAFLERRELSANAKALLKIANDAIVTQDVGGVWTEIQAATGSTSARGRRRFNEMVGNRCDQAAPRHDAPPAIGAVSLHQLRPPPRRIHG